MIILDTNVISELMHVSPDPNVVRWMDHQPRTVIWITSITIFEVIYGLEVMVTSKKQLSLRNSFQVLLNKLDDRVALFDEPAARQAAELMARRQMKGRPRDLRDTMIAGIALARKASLATRNISHFDDVSIQIVNPWAG